MNRFRPLRRRLLQGATAAALAPFGALAQDRALQRAGETNPLLLAKRRALVIGNARYAKEDTLKNPVNDARAIAAELTRTGFETTLATDATRAEMAARIREYGDALAREKAVGMFYFAGHGIQLSWRNYLVPVDAAMQTMDDVPKAAVDLAGLLEALKRAGNPANVVILDACRNNPFQRNFIVPAGLSQVDAPPASLLAYATAPGNVAADGEGDNGLYTAHLLREMRVQDAKIEDVFKRVRLAVRRASQGRQIPWESTSLEEDFYFLPPQELKALAEAEKARRFEEELALWEQVKGAREPAPIEQYLMRYPNGEFSELAQRALDVALAAQGEKRIEMAAQAGNPFTQGHVRADTDFKVGDYYTYRVVDPATRAERRKLGLGRITSVTDSEVVIGNRVVVLDRMGNSRQAGDGYRYTDNQNMPAEFQIGRRWTTRYRAYPPGVPQDRIRGETETEYRIVARERIQVPAGEFDCFRVEGRGRAPTRGGETTIRITTWYAPERCRRYVAHELERKPGPGSAATPTHERFELIDFRQT